MKNLAIIIIIISWMFGLTGDELVQKMEDRITPKDSKVDMVMTLTNKKGKTRESSLRSTTKDDGAKQIIWFLSPADDKGVSFLKIEYDDKDDDKARDKAQGNDRDDELPVGGRSPVAARQVTQGTDESTVLGSDR